MITKLMVLQKIKTKGIIEIFQVTGDFFQWTFETQRSKAPSDAEYYPFVISGKNKVWKRTPGAETKLSVNVDQIIFQDDYGVPGGTTIGILLPSGFIPDIIKFKDKPYIPVGLNSHVSVRPPGHIEILYNQKEKQSAVILNITENILFGFKCIAKRVSDNDFPKNENIYCSDFFDVSLGRDFMNIEAIHTDDLIIINQTLEQHCDLTQLKDAMNELLVALKTNNNTESKSILGKLSNILINTVGTASGLATIADSYDGGNSAYQFIHKVIEYTRL